ncbi:MAG TPA: hypothetical protein VIB82_09530, partial [Caulobacteraceae bacterium]
MTTKILSGIYSTQFVVASPVTTLSITATGYLGAGLISSGAGTYTLVNRGHVGGASYGVSLAGTGIVTNAGTLLAASTTAGAGLVLGAGGTVTNAAGALISGYAGVEILTAAGTVANDGRILSENYIGVSLADGGLISNGDATHHGALIEGRGAVQASGSATIHNDGTIFSAASDGFGVLLAYGTVTNGSAGDTAALIAGSNAFRSTYKAATVINWGTIGGTETARAVQLDKGGTVINGSAADIVAVIMSQATAVTAQAAATLINYGTILGSHHLPDRSYDAVGFGAGGVVTNGSTADTTARIDASGDVIVMNAAGTVDNYGTVGSVGCDSGIYLVLGGAVTNGGATDTLARIHGADAVMITGAAGTVSNFGTIGGLDSLVGVNLAYGGVVTNGGATSVTAAIVADNGVTTATNAATVRNFGTITAGASGLEAGIHLGAGGTVINGASNDTKAAITGQFGLYTDFGAVAAVTNFGAITGTLFGTFLRTTGALTNGSTADTSALIAGGIAGVGFKSVAGTVVNFGTILGGVFNSSGVALTLGGSVTNGNSADHVALIEGYIAVNDQGGGAKITNNGVIRGDAAAGSIGVFLSSGSSLTNNLDGLIAGYTGVSVASGDTMTNFGTVQGTGGVSIGLTGAQGDPIARLNAEAGSVLIGQLQAGAGLVDVVGGLVSATGITSAGKIVGAGTLLLNGGPSFLSAGA